MAVGFKVGYYWFQVGTSDFLHSLQHDFVKHMIIRKKDMIDRVLFLTGGSNLPPVFYYKKQLDIKKTTSYNYQW